MRGHVVEFARTMATTLEPSPLLDLLVVLGTQRFGTDWPNVSAAVRVAFEGGLELAQRGNGVLSAGGHHTNGEPLTGAKAITQLRMQRLALLCAEFRRCAQPAEVIEVHASSLLVRASVDTCGKAVRTAIGSTNSDSPASTNRWAMVPSSKGCPALKSSRSSSNTPK